MPELQESQSTRSERRVPTKLQLIVEGKDATGTPFRQKALTLDISRIGARLAPLQSVLSINSLVNLEYAGRKVVGRVVWLGKTPEERGQVGIRCLDEGKVPWADKVPTSLTSAMPATVETANDPNGAGEEGWPAEERRRAPRYACNAIVTLRSASSAFATSARLTDLSLTGGYLETMPPMPVGTEVQLEMETPNGKLLITAVVRTQHPAMGNGVAFTRVDVGSLRLLETLLSTLAIPASRAAAPAFTVSDARGEHPAQSGYRALALDPQIEALVELLERKSILNREELLLHLQEKFS